MDFQETRSSHMFGVLCFITFSGQLQAFYQLDNRRSEAPVGLQFADLLEQMITLAEDRLETG